MVLTKSPDFFAMFSSGVAIFCISSPSSSFLKALNSTATLGAALNLIHPSHVACDRPWSTATLPPNSSSGYGPIIVASLTYTFAVLTFSWNSRNLCSNLDKPNTTDVGCKYASPSPLVRTRVLLACAPPTPPPGLLPDPPTLSATATLGKRPAQITARTRGSFPALTLAATNARSAAALNPPLAFAPFAFASRRWPGLGTNGAADASSVRPSSDASRRPSRSFDPSSSSFLPPSKPVPERRNPIWSKSSTYCCRISLICRSVCADRNVLARKSRSKPRPRALARIHPAYALTSVRWSEVAPWPAIFLFASSASSRLSIGETKGDLNPTPAAMVSTGSRHENMAP
mmetsp:Transcript_2320/g.9422  ORF Transcript_2320/g.9422 Transcript_2320/m.9422 type:complete len:344 (-) Transcript_2320:67-1098(-)